MNQYALLAFGASPSFGEMLVVCVVVLMLFGAKRLPEIVRMIGRVLSELQKSSHELRSQILNLDAHEPEPRRPATIVSESTEPAAQAAPDDGGSEPDVGPADAAAAPARAAVDEEPDDVDDLAG